MFVSVEELDSSAYPEDFQEVEVKDELMEYDAVSCDLFYHINLMFTYVAFLSWPLVPHILIPLQIHSNKNS